MLKRACSHQFGRAFKTTPTLPAMPLTAHYHNCCTRSGFKLIPTPTQYGRAALIAIQCLFLGVGKKHTLIAPLKGIFYVNSWSESIFLNDCAFYSSTSTQLAYFKKYKLPCRRKTILQWPSWTGHVGLPQMSCGHL